MGVVKDWDRLSREARESPNLKVFKIRLDKSWMRDLYRTWTRDLDRCGPALSRCLN